MSSGFNTFVSGSKVPISYGAIMVNTDSVHTESTVYIYTSISNLYFNVYTPRVDIVNDVDDNYIVMPGYKLIVYKHGYDDSDSSYTIDNTNGTKPLFKAADTINSSSAYRLYYNNVELTELT